MSTADWLAARARSYHRDAQALAEFGAANVGGMTGDQWRAVYLAVSAELNKCAKEAE